MIRSAQNNLVRKSPIRAVLFAVFLLTIGTAFHRGHQLDAQTADEVSISISIDRSEVPIINDTSISLLIRVGDAVDITVQDENDQSVPFIRWAGSDQILVTTTAAELVVTLNGASDFTDIGQVEKTALKNNKRWAWSHSFDDNHYLEGPIEVMERLGLPATMYIVGNWIDSGLPWDGDMPEAEIIRLLESGWSLGNHTFDHDNNCGEQPSQSVRQQGILRTAELLDNLIARSNRPDYKVISFAVPCGGQDRFEAYHDLILEIREAQSTNLLFDEGGHDQPLVIPVSEGFDFDMPIKRDLSIDGVLENGDELKALFDSISQASAGVDGQPQWYNSFSHGSQTFGDNTAKLNDVAEYFVNTYGTNGTDEAWMAPADEIYSYLLVRELSEISTTVTLPETPAPTATLFVIPTTTPLPTSTPPSPTMTPDLPSSESPTIFLYFPILR